ncbi:MAG: ABC transporter permease subunit [Planctomycetia bacterium]|nr:ABC transporter permease subunit [Planctomycetia bacterium]
MAGFLAKRLLGGALVLLAIAFAVFFAARLAPGGPFDEERELPKDVRAALEARWHLHEPLPKQFAYFLGGLAKGDLGPSMRSLDWSVNEIVAASFPVSAALAALALAWAVPCGLWLGARAAVKPGGAADAAATGASLAGVALPSYVVAPVLVMVFALGLGALPPGGWGELRQVLLPAAALGLPVCAVVARLARAATRENLAKDYCRTARAKGLDERSVALNHALRNGLLPVLNYIGPATAAALTGSFAVEKVFAIPGLGGHFVNAALGRDFTLLVGVVLVYSALLVAVNIAVDVACAALDPRIREAL